MQWLNNSGMVKVSSMVRLSFSIGDYHDDVDCDIVPMQACHLLLGRPWQFDVDSVHFGHSNKYSFIHKEKKVVLVPLTPEDIHASDVARMKREESEKRKMSETHNNSKGENSKPSLSIQPTANKRVPENNECLLVTKGDLREMRNTTAPFFVLLHKDTLFSTNSLPSTLPAVLLFLIYCRTLRMCFLMRCQLVFLQYVALSTKLIWYLVLLFQIAQPTALILMRQKKFNDR